MSNAEEDDIRLHKASAALIVDFTKTLKVILWKPSGTVHRLVRLQDLNKAVGLIEPFQEEPQLVDPHLKHIVPLLVDAFLQQLHHDACLPRERTCTIAFAICRILYTLCKIRGEKVIVGFLNHDPPNVERILTAFEVGHTANCASSTWEERYVLLLWLWHLMLVPFGLQSLSGNQALADFDVPKDFPPLPPGLAPVAQRIIPICVVSLSSATKERDAAAKLLVRLSIREDLRNNAVLSTVVRWVLDGLRSETSDPSSLHQKLGLLSVLSNLTASAAPEVISPFLHQIYTVCQAILAGELNTSLAANAVGRKILIKTSRNIVLLCIQSPESTGSLDPSDILSEVVDALLTSVGDSDTPVRYAASKVLSAITLKLEPEMATEVIEAILSSLQEDVITDANGRQITDAVNALRWHGLTLALAQLLYRRAPSREQLPAILNALVLSLEFSQRSAAGVAMGTNVRDAACFGIWALSRRYTTMELLAVDLSEHQHLFSGTQNQSLTVPMWLATRLLAAACFDPAGNIRRGASAALQELIGRNPDTVLHGISLVQIVDYQAVGLRRRAMVDVGVRAASLDALYWNVLYDALQDGRAIFAVDELSREYAAEACGRLCVLRVSDIDNDPIRHLITLFTRIGPSITVQERHGLFLAISAVLEHRLHSNSLGDERETATLSPNPLAELKDITTLLQFPDKDFTSAARNPHLTATAICRLLAILTSILLRNPEEVHSVYAADFVKLSQRLFTLCLSRMEPEVLQMVPRCASNILKVSPDWQTLMRSWLASAANTQSFTKHTGHVLALGASFAISRERDPPKSGPVMDSIAARCGTVVDVDSRILAVRAVGLAIAQIPSDTEDEHDLRNLRVGASALHTALNDYTINQRGDVGSLVRLEALSALVKLSQEGWQWNTNEAFGPVIMQDVSRLSLEKLDKVRSTARSCIVELGWSCPSADQTSTRAWFSYWLEIMRNPHQSSLHRAIFQGFCSSAGMGPENVLQASRAALLASLDQLPLSSPDGSEFGLTDFASLAKSTLQENVSNERVVLPLLQVLAFLLEMQILQYLIGSAFKWRGLLVLVQKCHYQSKSVPKILLALDVYRGLAEVPEIRADVIKKLKDMKRNPMLPVKRATEETLYMVENM